jgi:hypothetical protein
MKYLKLYEARLNSQNASYCLHHSTNSMVSGDYFNTLNGAKQKALELMSKGHTSTLEIFKRGYHSTTQFEYLVNWWGQGYWRNVSSDELKKGDLSYFEKYIYGIEKALFCSDPHFNFYKILDGNYTLLRRLKNTKYWDLIIKYTHEIIKDLSMYKDIQEQVPDIWEEMVTNNPEYKSLGDLGQMGF